MHRRHRLVAAAGVALAVLAAATSATTMVDRRGSTRVDSPFVTGASLLVPVPSPTGAPTTEPAPAPSDVRQAQDVAPLTPVEAILELRDAGDTPPLLDVDRDNHIRTVSAAADRPLPPVPGAPVTTDPVLAAGSFVNRYGQGLGLAPGQQAEVVRVDQLPGGDHVVRLRQRIAGLPVFGGDLTVAVNPAGQIVSASAETPVDAPVTVSTPIADAGQRAVAAVAAQMDLSGLELVATSTTAGLFDPRLLGAPGRGELRTAWYVTVGAVGRAGEVASVFVDATDGTVELVLSGHQTARNRVICDLANTRVDLNDYRTYDCSDAPGGPAVVRREGGPASAVVDVNAAYDNLAAVYDFYQSNFGRDSIDGNGMPMAATVRACHTTGSCPYQNAFWDGVQMVFGEGFAGADDVVGHEMTHGLTTFTSDLYYFSESGGINEGISDIMGEFIDQTRGADDDSAWDLGEDLPFPPIRSMKSPSLHGDPEYVGDANWNFWASSSGDSYGVHHLSGVINKTAYLLAAGGTFNGVPVAGIGVPKSAQIWYRLEFLLPSGAEMADVATLLPAACRSVIGLKGITANDCLQAQAATQATNLGQDLGPSPDANLCPSPGMPTRTVFDDNLERGPGQWTLGAGWQGIPNSSYPLHWANSGQGALTKVRVIGVPQSQADLFRPITVPTDGPLYLSWAENLPFNGGGGFFQFGPSIALSSGSQAFTRGYVRRVAQFPSGFEGQTLPVSIVSWANAEQWLVDDVRLYQCLSNVVGAPGWVAAQAGGGGTTATVTWSAPQYAGPGVAAYEVALLPAPPSGPSLFVVPAGGALSLNLTGLDPAIRYLITVRARDAGAYGGPGVSTYLPGDGAFSCQLPVGGDRSRPICPGTPSLPPIPGT